MERGTPPAALLELLAGPARTRCGKACKDDPLRGKSASSLTHLVWLQKLLFVVQRWVYRHKRIESYIGIEHVFCLLACVERPLNPVYFLRCRTTRAYSMGSYQRVERVPFLQRKTPRCTWNSPPEIRCLKHPPKQGEPSLQNPGTLEQGILGT